jgi:exonuclease III
MEVEGQVDGGNAAVGAGAAVAADSPVHVVSWNVAGWIKTMEYIRKVREGFASARSRVLSALTQSHTLLCRALTRLTLQKHTSLREWLDRHAIDVLCLQEVKGTSSRLEADSAL